MMESDEDSDDTVIIGPASQTVFHTSPAQSLLEKYVSRTLPALPVSRQMEIVHQMLDIGVDAPADLEFVEESDLDTLHLKKVHLRKLLKDWKTEKESSSSESTSNLLNCSTSSSESELNILGNCSKSSDRAEMTIPWFKMPKELMAALNGGKRPLPSLRKEMVRIIVADHYKPNQALPRTRVFKVLAQEAVSRYPKSFMDEVDGIQIGSGYDSLLSQFLNRVDNLSRPKPTDLKRKVAESSGAEIINNKKRDSYGCINWQPMNLPQGETEASQEGMKAQLKEMHKSEPHVDQREVERLMAKTYASQRFCLNKADCALLDVVEEWPYLLAETHMLLHFKELVGIDLKQKMAEGFEKKSAKVYRFFQQHRSFTSAQAKIEEVMHAVSQACDATADETPKVIGLLYLLSAYLGEPVEQHIIPSQALDQPQDRDKLPGHPCLISKGNPLETKKFSLAVGRIVTTDVKNPLSALSMWFSAFYVFNLQYPSTAAGVPEFFQRCFLGINPPTGSKKGGKKSKVHSGVLRLANGLTTFESEWSCGQ